MIIDLLLPLQNGTERVENKWSLYTNAQNQRVHTETYITQRGYTQIGKTKGTNVQTKHTELQKTDAQSNYKKHIHKFPI